METIAKEIYKELGSGHRECVYHRAFELELRTLGIPYECEVVVPLFYKGQFLSHFRLDLVVDKKWVIELKATRSLKEDDTQQLKRYLKSSGIPHGYLINFGESFEIKRIDQEVTQEDGSAV